MAYGVDRARRIVGFSGKAGQAADRLGAHVLVRVGARHLGENRQVVQTIHGRAADARVGVFTRQGAERVGLVGAEVVDSGRADSRIGVLPSRLRAELFENSH